MFVVELGDDGTEVPIYSRSAANYRNLKLMEPKIGNKYTFDANILER